MEENSAKPINKKRKGKRIILGALVMILYITYKIGSPYIVTPSEIKELNKNINLPFNFGEEVSEEELKENGWRFEGDEYNEICYMNEYDDVLLLNGFPDLSREDKLVTFITEDEKIKVFGIGINDNVKDAREILKKFRYKEKSYRDSYRFTKGKVEIWITFHLIEQSVEGVQVKLLSTDWFHKGYYK